MPRSTIRQERGQRLQEARMRANLSQAYVAEQIGCSRRSVGLWEAGGNITCDSLAQMCVMYGCNAHDILFGAPHDEPTQDAVAQQFLQLEPGLRARLWMFYQVFIRRGVQPDLSRAPSLRSEQ